MQNKLFLKFWSDATKSNGSMAEKSIFRPHTTKPLLVFFGRFFQKRKNSVMSDEVFGVG